MENTAKNFALQFGALVSLYVSVIALVVLLFSIITIIFPDVANGSWEDDSARAGIRSGIAMLIVFFPTYLILTRIVNVARRKSDGVYLSLTKWLIYFSVLIAGIALLADFVMIIQAFLNGELTIRFFLKALSFCIVVGGAWSYYIYDARGYWKNHEQLSVRIAFIVSIIVLGTVIYGLMHIETPAEVREMKIDDKQVQDIMNMQSHIEAFSFMHGSLPETIDSAFDSIHVPQAPQGRAEYTYTVTGIDTYELCAEFSFISKENNTYSDMVSYAEPTKIRNSYVTWDHGAGVWCYTRNVQFETETH
jgi:hypothetical protein